MRIWKIIGIQGLFHYGKSTGTVSITGFLNIFFTWIWYQKLPECCRNLIITKTILELVANACTSLKKARALQHCPTQPGAVPQWVLYGDSTETIFYISYLNLVPKVFWEWGKTFILLLKLLKVAGTAWKILQGQFHCGYSTGTVPSTGFGKMSYFGPAIWVT